MVPYFEARSGAGPALLLVHGFLSSRSQWLPNLRALSSVCRPIVVELFGHARSPSPAEPAAYTANAYVAAFERIREGLGVERWIVCGQSLGAALTLRYALDHPERVIAQVFTNSNSALADAEWEARVRPALEAQARDLEARGRPAIHDHPLHPRRSRRLPAEIRERLVADAAWHDPSGIARTLAVTIPGSRVRERIAENRVPALLVAGAREAAFEPQRRMARSAMPLLEVVEVDAGHAVNLEAAADFDAAVTAFVRRHG